MTGRRTLTGIGCAAMLLCSCGRTPLEVTDRSFEFQASVCQDRESSRNLLVLTLERGGAGRYEATWKFTGEGAGALLDGDGNPAGSRISFDVGEDGRKTFPMKGFSRGPHRLEMDISTDDYTQELRQDLDVPEEPFSFSTAVVTEGTGPSFLVLTLSEGQDRKRYTGTVTLDGGSLTGDGPVELDFNGESIWTITFPHLRPGRHKAAVTVMDGKKTETAVLEFEEPLKYPEADLILDRDRSGRYTATMPFNPYRLRLKGRSVLRLKAQCVFVLSPPDQETRVKTVTDTADVVFGRKTEEAVLLQNRDSLVREIQQMKEKSALYRKVHVGGMVDPGWDYVVTGYEDHYYYLTGEDLIIDMECEQMEGVTLTVDNRIGDIIWNGKIRPAGRFTETGAGGRGMKAGGSSRE